MFCRERQNFHTEKGLLFSKRQKLNCRTEILLVLLFFGIETIYVKWQDPQLNFGENARRLVLYVYTLAQALIVIRFIFEFKNFIWGEKAAKVVEAKKSFQNMPTDYKDILDVEKHPKLK